jgi:hypothetical protein
LSRSTDAISGWGWSPIPIHALPAGVVTRMNKLLAEGDRDGVVEALFRSVEEISDEDMAALRSAATIGNLIDLF